ncbi:MAG: cysteine--tRNA ligase [Bacteroidales bacterium]|nr:cysteine--tRNA ligase [Bacteroidales bacterium]
MTNNLFVYNTLTRKKERFEPINPPFVGLYACGPTVYGDAHLGHARQAITFDVLYRYLQHLDYKVRYVRNITDVGHLVDDSDDGEDKILKKARLESLEPMEVVQHYMNRYHQNMESLNVLPPSIEPRASGHIIEQQELIRKIMEAGYAYEVNGSVYFDVIAYNNNHPYGQLSGRKIEDLLSNTRTLDGQSEKKNGLDFALWKKAGPSHIMRWPSKWSEGYPGWHLECSAMSTKYLGMQFDIHGGGMDLLFPHHECEIAQNVAGYGQPSVRYWMHNNMITINGQKMGRSLGNFITLDQLFEGNHKILEQAYGPMVIRFFILQAHYRSTLDFSNEAMQASEKGLMRLMNSIAKLKSIQPSNSSSIDVDALAERCKKAMEDDMNTAKLVGHLLGGITQINNLAEGRETISEKELEKLINLYHSWVFSVLGLELPSASEKANEITGNLIEIILQLRSDAKLSRNFKTADRIRNELTKLGITVKDRKDGADWEIN